MSQKIPIFPVGVVLIPYMSLHLPIFEKKFIDMIYHCKKHSIDFGTIFLCGKTMQRVGCIAHVEEATCTKGKMDITVTGTKRFVVQKLYNNVGSFPEAKIHSIKDRYYVASKHRTLVKKIQKQLRRFSQLADYPINENKQELDDPVALSFRVSSIDIFSIAEKQELLELRSTIKRLIKIDTRLIQAITQRENLLNLNHLVGSVEELQYILN